MIITGFRVNPEHRASPVQPVLIDTIDFDWVRGDCAISIISGHSIRAAESLPIWLIEYLTQER